jgi:tetratricopeptide (TPR) repeat protein
MSVVDEWIKFAPKPRPLEGRDQWNVFVSYRSVDRAWVLNMYDSLRQQGYNVFLDQRVPMSEDEFIRVEDALDTSQAGVLIWPTSTRDSDWARHEYEVLARQANNKKDFRFIPIRVGGSTLPAFVDSRVFLEFDSYPDGPNGGELLRLLYALTGLSLGHEAAQFANERDELGREIAAKIVAATRHRDHELLVRLFKADALAGEPSPVLGNKIATGLTKLACYDEALAVLKEIETRFSEAIRPKQLYALALARRGRSGDLERAQDVLAKLYQIGERDPETLGIYGRTWMDRFERSGDLNDLRQARNLYAEAFDGAPDDYYTGINAAAKSLLLGSDHDLALASEYAQRVQEIVGEDAHPGDYWMTATAAELFLIRAKYEDAAKLYKAAVAIASSEIGSHLATWTEACRLMTRLNPTAEARALIRNAFVHLPDCHQILDRASHTQQT